MAVVNKIVVVVVVIVENYWMNGVSTAKCVERKAKINSIGATL